jgi:hypothetical protein
MLRIPTLTLTEHDGPVLSSLHVSYMNMNVIEIAHFAAGVHVHVNVGIIKAATDSLNQ